MTCDGRLPIRMPASHGKTETATFPDSAEMVRRIADLAAGWLDRDSGPCVNAGGPLRDCRCEECARFVLEYIQQEVEYHFNRVTDWEKGVEIEVIEPPPPDLYLTPTECSPRAPWDISVTCDDGKFTAWRGGSSVEASDSLEGADDAGLHLYVSEPDEDGFQNVCVRSRQ